MPFKEYFEWEKKNVIHLESEPRVIKNSLRARIVSWESWEPVQKNKKQKTTVIYCLHCGAPVIPYKEKCDYCDCYY